MLHHLRPVGMLLFLAAMYGGVANAIPVENVAGIETIQQNGTASGVVKDALGEAVIGASVVVKGTTNGTITDFDGNFSISGYEEENEEYVNRCGSNNGTCCYRCGYL